METPRGFLKFGVVLNSGPVLKIGAWVYNRSGCDPPLSVTTWGGGSWGGRLEGVGGGVGWRVSVGGLEGGWGGGSAVTWGGGGLARWGGLRATHYYHMHTSRRDVCLGRVWGSC